MGIGIVAFSSIVGGAILLVAAIIVRSRLRPRTKAARDEYESWMAECDGAHRVSSRSLQLHRRYLRLLQQKKQATQAVYLAVGIMLAGLLFVVYYVF